VRDVPVGEDVVFKVLWHDPAVQNQMRPVKALQSTFYNPILYTTYGAMVIAIRTKDHNRPLRML
jgi:hypothetical protein